MTAVVNTQTDGVFPAQIINGIPYISNPAGTGLVPIPAGASSTTIRKIKSSMQYTAGANAVSQLPMIAPPAWVANTAYTNGMAVTNSSNSYICITGGTSAASGGPTTTNNGPIADNTANWYYAGPSFSSVANAPTATLTSSAYTGVYYRTTTGSYPIGSSQISDSTNFFVTGGIVTESGQNNGFALTANTTNNPNGQLMSVQFMCDAKQLQVHTAQYGAGAVQFYCDQFDGRGLVPINLGVISANSGGSQNYWQFVWPNQRARLYIAEVPLILANGLLGVVLNETTSRVWAPSYPNKWRCHVVGDSFLAGATYYPVTGSLAIFPQTLRELGCTDFILDGQSGTGFTAASSTSIFGSPQRLAFMLAMQPDVVWISGGTNDSGVSTATIQAAVTTYLQAIRAQLPNVLIFISGSNNNNSGPSSGNFAVELGILQAVSALNDPFTYYYPVCYTTTNKAWLSGTGTTSATTGTGNCDWYIASDQHPTYAGAAYLGYRHAVAFRGIVNGMNQ